MGNLQSAIRIVRSATSLKIGAPCVRWQAERATSSARSGFEPGLT